MHRLELRGRASHMSTCTVQMASPEVLYPRAKTKMEIRLLSMQNLVSAQPFDSLFRLLVVNPAAVLLFCLANCCGPFLLDQLKELERSFWTFLIFFFR